jgi:hypothetical protein
VGVIKNWPTLTPVAAESGKGIVAKSQRKDAAIRTVKRLQAGSAYPNAAIESSEVVMYDDGPGCIGPALRASDAQTLPVSMCMVPKVVQQDPTLVSRFAHAESAR